MRYVLATLVAVLVLGLPLKAQDGELLDYQQEVGGAVGLSSYIGDAAGGFLKHPGLMGSFIWRRNFNQRMTLKTNLAMGYISGNTKGVYLPTDPRSQTPEGGVAAPVVSFSRNLIDLGAQFELNFLGYGMGAAYKGLSRWSPYLLAGAGVVVAFGGGAKAAGGLCFPVGAGVRYKIRPRLNVGFEWTVRFSTSDKLDDSGDAVRLIDPYGIKSDVLKNKDCYTAMLLFITYDISPKYRKCNN